MRAMTGYAILLGFALLPFASAYAQVPEIDRLLGEGSLETEDL